MPLPQLLTAADNPAIRSAIRADLRPSDLADVVVATSYTTAVSQVLRLDPNAGTYAANSDQAQRAHDAAVFYAAAFLAPVVPQIIREGFQNYSYAVQPYDPQARADALREMAAELLAINLGVDLVDLLRPKAIALAPGGRGDVSDDSPSDFRLATFPFP